MNVMTPTGGFGLTEILIHAGYMLTAAAFLLRDILWLRLLAIAANLCVGLAAYRAGMDPHWVRSPGPPPSSPSTWAILAG